MTRFTPPILARVLAKSHTPQELCEAAEASDSATEGLYLDALAIHAHASSWGALIEQSINRWEDDSGLV